MTGRRLDRGVSDGWAWRRWNDQLVEDNDPVVYGDAWHYELGRVVVAAARLELELAFLASYGRTGSLDSFRVYLRNKLRDEATEAAKLPTARPGALDAVRIAKAALNRRDHLIHWPPIGVVVPDGDPPPGNRSVSGHWRLPTTNTGAPPVDVATTAELRGTRADLEAAWGPVAAAARGISPPLENDETRQ